MPTLTRANDMALETKFLKIGSENMVIDDSDKAFGEDVRKLVTQANTQASTPVLTVSRDEDIAESLLHGTYCADETKGRPCVVADDVMWRRTLESPMIANKLKMAIFKIFSIKVNVCICVYFNCSGANVGTI